MNALKAWLRSGNLGDNNSVHALSVLYAELGDADASTLWKSRLAEGNQTSSCEITSIDVIVAQASHSLLPKVFGE